MELTRGGTTGKRCSAGRHEFSGVESDLPQRRIDRRRISHIVDRNGEIIYHPRQQLIYADLIQENNQGSCSLPDGTHWETFQGEQRQITTVKTVGYTGWKLVGVVPANVLRKHRSLILFVISVLLFSIFLLILHQFSPVGPHH